ncbi:unnamed protein product [Hymenolepis diminuta]|uniref:Mitochondrial thiamine pyrophosphate carrier n=1 Tax=Hymenolepis diminuta TaxID=6216 RepID=A0A158QE69_HYMDI|nr:unnamed protein product [Hymenolepis diminuta]VUZ47453.1 unnamed protein product [Hymenolepis diminuta]
MVGFDKSKYQNLSNADFVVAGCFSGFCGRACVQPLDVVKVRFQLQVEPISAVQESAKYRSVFQAIKCIAKEEGFGAFWKGHLSSQILAVSYSGIQFTSFELFTRWYTYLTRGIQGDPETRQFIASAVNFICGCLAGVTAATCTQPLDVLKTRFIAQGEPRIYNNIREAIVSIAKKEGFQGFFRGLSPSILLTAPQTGLNFAVYKLTVNLFELWDTRVLGRLPTDPSADTSMVRSVTAGSVAGMVSKCLVYPMDVAKKRLQVQGFEDARSYFGRPLIVRGLRDCIVKTWRNEGMAGLFKGLQPSILKACISMGCRFAVYEKSCDFLSHRNIARAIKPTE